MKTDLNNNKTVPFVRKLRDKLFFLFHHLLLFKDIPPYLGSLLILLQLVQTAVLTVNKYNPYLLNYFFSDIIEHIDVIQFYPLVSEYFSGDARIATNVALLIFLIAISLSLIILSTKKDYSKNASVQYIAYLMGFFYEATTKLLFVPIFGTFIVTLQCDGEVVTCFTGRHIILLVSSIIGMALLLIISYIIDAFFFDFSFKTKDSLAHAPVQDFVLGFIYKTVAVILTVGIFNQEYSSVTALYLVLFNLFFLYNSITKVTYFNITVHVSYCIQTATLIWTNGSFLAADLIDFDLLRDNTIIIILIGSYFFVNFSVNIRKKTQDHLLTKEGSELESDILLDAKVRFFFDLAKSAQTNSQSDLLLASLMKIHIDHCSDVRCPCKSRETLYDPKRSSKGDITRNPHKDLTFLKHFIYYILKTGSTKFFNSELLFLDSIFFLFEAMRNYPQAYHLIHVYEKKNLSNNPRLVMQFLIYRLYAKMKDYVDSTNQKVSTTVLVYEKIMQFDEELATLKGMIFSQIEHYINVWEMIDSEFPDLNILNKLLEKTYNHREVVLKQYQKAVKINDQSLEMKVVMDIYAQYVAYDDELGSTIDSDIQTRIPMDNHSDNFNFQRDMDFWNIFDPNCYTIEIANQMDRLGQIINFSKNTLGILGFQDQELRFQNVKILIPRVIAIQHDKILKDFFQNGMDKGLREPIHNFTINNRGYCFSCHIILKAIPMHGHYRLLALFRKLNQYDYIVTDDKGTIDTFGEKIGQMLELTPQQAMQARLNLALIAPKVIKYFHYYLMKKVQAVDEEALTKPKTFYIFIPNNWKTFLQKWQEKRRGKGAMSIPSISSAVQETDELADIDEYYANMLEFMRHDIKKNFRKVIKVKAIIQHITLRRGELQMKSLKIISYKEKDPSTITSEKIKKQEELVPILAKKINKILEQRKIDLAHRLELAKHIAQQEEDAADDDTGKAKDGAKKDDKDKKGKGFPNATEQAKKAGKKNDKSLETLLRADSKASNHSDDSPDDKGDGTLGNVSRDQFNSQSEAGSQTDKVLVKKTSILKKKSLKDSDKTFEKKPSIMDRFKKKVKIVQDKPNGPSIDGQNYQIGGKNKKNDKTPDNGSRESDKQIGYIALVTEESSVFDVYDLAENGELQSVETEVLTNKERKEMLKELAKGGIKEAQEMLEKKNIGPSSVASSSSYAQKDFSHRIKGLLKGHFIPSSLKMSNLSEILLTLIALILINVLSAVIKSHIGKWVSSIEFMNTPNLYEVYLYKVYDSYLTLDLLSQNVLDSTVYDNTWYLQDQGERQEIYTNIRTLSFQQISDILHKQEVQPLYFGREEYNLITNGQASTLTTNFLGYISLVMNAINETLNYDMTKYQNIANDEYLYLLYNNFFVSVGYIDIQKQNLINRVADTLDKSQSLLIAELVSGIGIILGSLFIILPMFLQHNLHLEEVLVLFTNISKRDSDFFYKHYRAIRLTWNGNYDDYQRLQKEVLEEAKIEAINKRMSKLNTNSKSRPFLRLKRDYKKFTAIISTSIILFSALAVVKMVVIRSQLNEIDKYSNEFTLLSEEASVVFKILHNYKILLNEALQGNTPTTADLTAFQTRLNGLSASVDYDLPIKDQSSMGVSGANTELLQNILIGDLCLLVSSSDQAECRSLFNGALSKGYLAIRYDIFAFVTNYFTRFQQVLTSNPSNLATESNALLNDEDLKEYLSTWTMIQELIFNWLNSSYQDVRTKKDTVISRFNLFLAFLSLCLVLNLVTWRYSYVQLIGTLHKFHKYFEILPLELIRDNRSIRSYFERYFKIKENYH